MIININYNKAINNKLITNYALFSRENYNIDFLKSYFSDLEITSIKEIIKPDIVSSNAILEELKSFHQSILTESLPVVSHLDGSAAMDLAFEIMSKM